MELFSLEERAVLSELLPRFSDRGWLDVIEGAVPAAALSTLELTQDAMARDDLEALFALIVEDVLITQPVELPGARAYHGHRGYVEAMLDWPQQWATLTVEPKRMFAIEDTVLMVGVHRGRPRAIDIDVEAEITWAFRYRDGKLARWAMYMTVDDAIAAARSGILADDVAGESGDRAEGLRGL